MMPDDVARGTTPPSGGLADTDLADWRTADDAAAEIGCSKRTIERLAAARTIESRIRPQAGSPGVAVYNPLDVARIASERKPAPAPFVLPAIQTPTNGNGHHEPGQAVSTRLTRASADDPIRQLAAAFERFLLSPPSPPVAGTVAERAAYVDKTEALAIAGVSYGELRDAVNAGEVKQRGVRYRRRDLEAL